MLIPFLVYCFYKLANLDGLMEDFKNPENENDLFVLLMNQTGKTICDYQFQNVPRETTFNHYKSHIPETDREIVTWEKYKFIIIYLNWFDKRKHFDEAKMEDFFCKGSLVSNMAAFSEEQVSVGAVLEVPDQAIGRDLLFS